MKEIERFFEIYKENIELKENDEKMKVVKRLRRIWGLKCELMFDLIDFKSLFDIEYMKDMVCG